MPGVTCGANKEITMSRLFLPALISIIAGANVYAAQPAITVPGSVNPTLVPTNPPPTPAEVPQPISADLIDGSKVEIDADGTVWVLNPKGGKTAAPDGTMTLKDGTPFIVKDGKRLPGED